MACHVCFLAHVCVHFGQNREEVNAPETQNRKHAGYDKDRLEKSCELYRSSYSLFSWSTNLGTD